MCVSLAIVNFVLASFGVYVEELWHSLIPSEHREDCPGGYLILVTLVSSHHHQSLDTPVLSPAIV